MEIAIHLSGYCLTEQIYVSDRTLVYRGIRSSDQLPVVVKLLRNPLPSFNELLQFRNQYIITHPLDLPNVVKHLAIEPYQNAYGLVMEDFGGVSLKQVLKARGGEGMGTTPQALTEFLHIALQLTEALDGLSRHRIIHKDIKPANILIHPNTKQVKLIDFSIASLLPRETQNIQNPNVLEGTLAYISPEQTGRMNRGIDYRSDFYSLGVTLYRLLTGSLPFLSDDPVELAHCHLAKQPIPAHQVVVEIPIEISLIVSKLMAKNAEDRYQSALGLKHDLEQCLHQLQTIGEIESFSLGQRDYTDRFLVSEKLYGRTAEINALLAAFDRISSGSTEMILVAGLSGIGKTAVVNEVHKPIARGTGIANVKQRSYFIKGKYDQFQRNIPLSAFVQAFSDLIFQLLSEPDTQLQQWKQKLLSAVGEEGQVLIDLIPELENILGQQPAPTDLPSSAAQNRFDRLFQKFIQVFTTAEHPLVIFLDDLQWADSASLKLLKLLMGETSFLLIIAAYRNNEVSPSHPLIQTVAEIRKANTTVSAITLQPLDRSTLTQLVADTLNCNAAVAVPLADLVHQKTQGNPFFARQFLRALHEDGQIVFDWTARCWQSDISQVRAKALTDNVVEFMAFQLQKLPATTQSILKLAACIGNQFDLNILAIVSETSIEETASRLWRALQEGFILPATEVYKFLTPSEVMLTYSSTVVSVSNATYRFLHDRVQQAAYSLITPEKKHETHLKIGRLLLGDLAEAERKKKLLEVVNQLNAGSILITTSAERDELAQLNLVAGQRARAATAYIAAAEYFSQGISLLGSDRWQNQYPLALALHESALEAAYLNSRFTQLEVIAEEVLKQARSALDTMRTRELQILAYIAQENAILGVEVALNALASLGICVPNPLTTEVIEQTTIETNALVADRGIQNLIHLPPMTDRNTQAALQIVDNLFTAAYIAAPNLLPMISALVVKLSIIHGNAPLSVVAYTQYGAVLCSKNEIEAGYQFGQLALNLLSQHESKEFSTKVLCMVAAFILPWKIHFRETLPLLRQGYENGLEAGMMNYAAFNYYHECRLSYLSGRELSDLETQLATCSQALRQINQELPLSYTELLQQVVQNLINPSIDACCLGGEAQNESEFQQRYQTANNREGLYQLFFYKLVLCYRFEKYELASKYADLAAEYSDSVPGQVVLPLFYCYDSLVHLTALSTDRSNFDDRLERVAANQIKLKQWATFGPMNFQHLYLLVEAERYRLLGNRAEAIEHYDRAIALAQEHQYLSEESLAHELAAKFYLEWGKVAIAQSYIQSAYYAYSRWGARAKVEDLERRYPQLLSLILQQQPLSFALTEAGTVDDQSNSQTLSLDNYESSKTLDLATLLKASQTLSSEIELEKLLSTLVEVVIENAGADKCVFLLPKNGQWVIEAISGVGYPTIVLQSLPLQIGHNVPVSLVNTVKRSHQPSLISNVEADSLLAVEPYILQQRPQSILCTPILNQSKLIGILYLENSLTVGAFTHDRIEVLNFLCTQAAISLENARLYHQAQQAVTTLQSTALQLEYQSTLLRGIIDATSDWIFVKDRDFRFVLVNRGFANAVGRQIEDMIGKDDLELGVPEQFIFGDPNQGIKGFRIDDQKVLSGESVYDPYVPSTDANGEVRIFDTQRLPLRNANDEVVGVIAICIDVTERQKDQVRLRESEAQLRHQAEALQKAFQELQRTQTQLVQSEKMSALGNLVAAVGHEINNPIGFLSGNINPALEYMNDLFSLIDLYQQKYPTPDVEIQREISAIELDYIREDLPKLIGSMQEGVDRIRNISTSLRTFSRADSDRPIACNIHDGIDSTLLILTHRLKANEIRPAIEVVKIYGQLPPIECFAGQLNQVFMNVLANAIDAIEESVQGQSYEQIKSYPKQIQIKTELANDQTFITIHIRDNGVGMTEAVKQKVFDHLFTTKEVGKGTGLGLAIVHQIVMEKHNGSLEVNSIFGEGTAFIIKIPVRSAIAVSS